MTDVTTGQMGWHMASNLASKSPNSTILVNDYNKSVADKFKQEFPSARVAATPLEIAKECSIIVTMLPASPQVKSVYLGDDGLIHGVKEGTMLIDSSTIDPSTSKDLFTKFTAKKVQFLDAPVSGGKLA